LAILVAEVKRCALLLQIKGSDSSSTNEYLENIVAVVKSKNFESSKSNLAFQKTALLLEKKERDELYETMKHENESQRLSDFKKFGIASQKKRKRTLADMVWKNISHAEESAISVRHLRGSTSASDLEWYDEKKNAHMRTGVFFVARDAMLVLTAISKWRRSASGQSIH
jgi:hypothetical protein